MFRRDEDSPVDECVVVEEDRQLRLSIDSVVVKSVAEVWELQVGGSVGQVVGRDVAVAETAGSLFGHDQVVRLRYDLGL